MPGPLADLGGHRVGRLVVAAKFIGKTGVGVGADGDIGHPGEVGYVLPELLRSEGAIEPNRQRPRVCHADPECLGCLP